ncbi:MAG: FAD-binding oxidoreductase [Chloroflexi bacterium]|nr:FAD-binding oxidoreductase [Chloroflexota bacterium]
MTDRRSFWAWGLESGEPSATDLHRAARDMSARFGRELKAGTPPKLSDLRLRQPRVSPPDTLARFCTTDTYERALHSYGHSYPDRVRKFNGDISNPPDFVARPASESDVETVLDWCDSHGAVAVPFGGGSSVVGGVETPSEGRPAVSLDLGRLDKVLDIDGKSRAARIQAGALGPAIESQLKPHGLTLRHFPQSFEFSSLGGWIATRSAGHYATNQTHIDEFVESVRMITPAGVWESRRLPGSGAGPSPDRLTLGSEGTLGVITEAWMRVQARPRFREGAGVLFSSTARAAEAARRITQAKLWPANCRVLDRGEAATAAGLDGSTALLVLGFESAEFPQESLMRHALEICLDERGKVVERTGDEPENAGPVEKWRQAFIGMPYVWNSLLGFGLINDTFETAITWDRWEQFDNEVRQNVMDALQRICGGGTLTCRFTHVYPDGPAPYYTFTALGRPGSEVSMWREIKSAASEAVARAGGTITHHHAVGRDHKVWYSREVPGPFLAALRAAKRELDPNGVLNPGVLFDP